MYNKSLLSLVCLVIATISWGQNKIKVNTLTEKGAWCWFADPRAVSFQNESGTINNTYIGYIDVHGNIKATQINHLTNTTNEILIRSWFQPDDHNNPTFLVLPDERIMIFYSRHTDEPCFYYRISQKPGDITMLGKEVRLETAHNTTYPSPFILSDDPDHIYLCWRGIGWHPTIGRLTMPDKNDEVRFDWGPHQIIQSQEGARGVRPYAKYMSNGKEKIYLAYTTTHPDNQSVNYIYFNYIDINTFQLKDIKGKTLETVGSGMLHNVEANADYKINFPNAVVEDSTYRNWLWEISVMEEHNPVIAMVRINDNKDSHDYYYVRWTGNEWQKTFLSNAGGHFHQTPTIEKCYSGGMAIDKTDPNVIYASVPVDGKHGNVYELKKYTVAPKGILASAEQLTFDSQKNNVRPYVISNKNKDLRLAWMSGDYYDWIVSSMRPDGFATAIRTNMEVPYIPCKGTDNQSAAFTIIMELTTHPAVYSGSIIKTNDFSYGILQEEYSKPYIEIRNKKYKSTNVLGNSDAWKVQNRETGGHWYPPIQPEKVQLAISYENGILRTYLNGLIDQSVEINELLLSEEAVETSKSIVENMKMYKYALSQHEIQTLNSK